MSAESELIELLERSVNDPFYFVMAAFEWGEGDLAATEFDANPGPDNWQAKTFDLIKEHHLTSTDALQIAVASGNGIGKGCNIAQIILWFMCTKPMGNGVVTANTSSQLETKTWRELGLWFKRLIPPLREMFELTATKIYRKGYERTWFVSALPWSENNADAFGGMHADWVLMIFDEASNIAKPIWESAAGSMTTPHAIWLAYGNPWRNSGGFFDCFNSQRHRWIGRQIDSRTCKRTNKDVISKWVEDYGEDSDFIAIHVKGTFPKAGTTQLISTEVVDAAMARFKAIPAVQTMVQIQGVKEGARVLGVDVARFGHNMSKIWFKQGRYAKQIFEARGMDTMQLAARVAEFIKEIKPAACFVDGGGVGGGVVDRLRQLGHHEVIEVQNGQKANDPTKYANLRTEMWSKMAEWLKGAAVEPRDDMRTDLISPEYYYDRNNRRILEAKDDMEKRGLSSPDSADSLAICFCMDVAEPEPMDKYKKRDRYNREHAGNQGSPMSA